MSSASILTTRRVEKVWGRETLPSPFSSADGERIGEIWFEPPAELSSLLVKYLFTSEKLSVQVHPNDAQAKALGEDYSGKEECWFVLDAEADAKLAIGFDQPLSAEEMRSAALDGSIEDKLTWHTVTAGDFFYIPAGTVHAIGPGVSLIEVQQNSDITYRLFDYGRPRELHLDEAMTVARGEPYAPEHRRAVAEQGCITLVDGPYFRLDRVDGQVPADIAHAHSGRALVLPLNGTADIGGVPVAAGECAMADNAQSVTIPANVQALLVSSCK